MNKKSLSRSIFKTNYPVKEIPPTSLPFLQTLMQIQCGELGEGIIAQLPHNEGFLHIDSFKVTDITEKHGGLPLENMIITATEPTSATKSMIEKIDCLTLIYEFGESGFILSTRKFNGHYVVTFFEPSDLKYIQSVKKRGTLLFDQKKTP